MLKSAALIAALVVITIPGPALAGFSSDRENDGSTTGTVSANDGSSSGGGGSSSQRPTQAPCARSDGTIVACETDLGWWSNTYRCYLKMIRDAGPDDPEHPGEALFRCDPGPMGWDPGAVASVMLWLDPGAAGPDPRVLAFEAIDKMRLLGVDVGMAPPAGTEALVNAPVWMWAANPNANTWGPITASATAGSVTVSATAQATKVTWAMGDGAKVECGKGTAYSGPTGGSADCTHTYRTPGTRTITATTTWRVMWESTTGVSGTESLESTSTAAIQVREARARVTSRS